MRRRSCSGRPPARFARLRARTRRDACSQRPRGMTLASQPGLPGTRPEGVTDETQAAAHVREMFGRIAPRYDLLNHLLSLDLDKIWRRRVAKKFGATLRD